MIEGVEDQEVSYLCHAFFIWLDPIFWSLWKGKRISHSLFQEGLGKSYLLSLFLEENPINCCFLQISGENIKKIEGSNDSIPPSPINESGDLVVLGL